MATIYSLNAIRKALADRKLTVVAENTGIAKGTLYNLTREVSDNIDFKTYQILTSYLFPDTDGAK